VGRSLPTEGEKMLSGLLPQSWVQTQGNQVEVTHAGL
jgi:hypothetical protein